MRYIASAFLGFAISGALFVLFVIPQVRQNWRAQGQNEGALAANVRMHKTAEKYFPKTSTCSFVETLGGAKPNTINIVDCGSYKTLTVTE